MFTPLIKFAFPHSLFIFLLVLSLWFCKAQAKNSRGWYFALIAKSDVYWREAAKEEHGAFMFSSLFANRKYQKNWSMWPEKWTIPAQIFEEIPNSGLKVRKVQPLLNHFTISWFCVWSWSDLCEIRKIERERAANRCWSDPSFVELGFWGFEIKFGQVLVVQQGANSVSVLHVDTFRAFVFFRSINHLKLNFYYKLIYLIMPLCSFFQTKKEWEEKRQCIAVFLIYIYCFRR